MDGEPPAEARCQIPPRRPVSYEMIEERPTAGMRAPSQRQPIRASADPDADLVREWQAGDLDAFPALVRRHERKVFRLLMRMLGNREEAEDVAQEAFLSLHRHGHRFRGDSRFSTFVYRVAANAALNRRRSLGRSRARQQGLVVRHAAGDDLPSAPRGPEDAAAGSEVQSKVQEALLELPRDLHLAVVLYDIEGLSYREIADVLRVPEGTVKSRIHRARNALREALRAFVSAQPEGVAP